MVIHHLRLRPEIGIKPVQKVEHHAGMIGGDGGGGEDRVQYCEIGLRDEAQHTRGLTEGQARRGKRGDAKAKQRAAG
jgi:hypothetical protein